MILGKAPCRILATDYWLTEIQRFNQLLPRGSVLDIGSGNGREAKHFLRLGYTYTGIDPSQTMIRIAREKNPTGTFIQSTLEAFAPGIRFDGFWACASLIHVPKKRITSVLIGLQKILNPGAIGFISVKEGTEEGMKETSLSDIRYFSDYSEEEFISILRKCGYDLIEVGRKTKWLFFFVKSEFSTSVFTGGVCD
jgi:2-polyprenyl-3-methyl-5-hydroxy-6-metoxy-1,4-benzoquinol methylase